jgi:hypothetical protein
MANFSRAVFPSNVIKEPIQIASVFEYIVKLVAFYPEDIPNINNENKLKLSERLIGG